MLLLRRPAMRVPTLVQVQRTCRNDKCYGLLPPAASFCPRCGARARPALSEVA